ncbi:MAG: hypothetical protein PHV85_10200 [Desulfovibrionaceae bacterium]|nr:hypothetical protein [Desulfovibrionaceae bacterium]MDD5628736.1 hypothetical protein [Elusimicrobiota bacterium]
MSLLFSLLWLAASAPAAQQAPADPAQLFQKDQARLIEAGKEWTDYLDKVAPEAKEKYGPELARIKTDIAAAQDLEQLKPAELRLETWRKSMLRELFPSLQGSLSQSGQSAQLVQAQVQAYQALAKLQQSSLSPRQKKAVESLRGRIGLAADSQSLDRLFDNAGFARPETMPQPLAPITQAPTAALPQAGLKTSQPPAAEAPEPPSEGILSYLDVSKAKKLAQSIWSKAKGFSGYCYAAVKEGLDKILPSGWRSQVGPASAYQFATSLNRNPKLFDKLKLRKLDPAALSDRKLPVGAIIVYGRGMCGFSPKHGHIEVVVSENPPKACSDGCMGIPSSRFDCIKKNSPRNWVNVYVPVRSPAP